MKTEPSKTVLLSLVGATPAVLTETVWAPATRPEPVFLGRIIAITTSLGNQKLREKLFSDDHWERMLADLTAQGVEVKGKLQFGDTGYSIRVFTNLDRAGARLYRERFH